MINKLTFRFSTPEDAVQIDNLMKQRFGIRTGYLDNLQNRYYLAFDNKKLIAMSGLSKEITEYKNAYEIDWTCIDENYEKNGIITHMLSFLLKDVDKNVYCRCWKSKKGTHIKNVLTKLGFECIIENETIKSSNIHKCCCKENCVLWQENCSCSENLFIKYIEENKDVQ